MPTPYKLIIAGGRDFNDRTMFDEGLQWFAQDAAPVKFVDPSGVDDGAVLEIVSGMAKGADSLGAEYAQEVGIPLHKFPANWKDLEAPGAVVRQGPYGPYNVNAGFDRNRRMAEAANGVLLYPGGKGTAHMAQIAQELSLDVFDYRDPAKPVVLRPSAQQSAAANGGPEIVQSLLDYSKPWGADDVYLFTGNPVRKTNGAIVMGRGAALQVRDTYPGVDQALGKAIEPGRGLAFVDLNPSQKLGWFQVKDHWRDDAKLDLIASSSKELAALAQANPQTTYHLNAPGIGNGRLGWNDVEPILQELPGNVKVYVAPGVTPKQFKQLELVTPPAADGPAPVEESVMAGKRWPLVLAAAGGLTALGAGVYMAQNDKKATGVSVPVA